MPRNTATAERATTTRRRRTTQRRPAGPVAVTREEQEAQHPDEPENLGPKSRKAHMTVDLPIEAKPGWVAVAAEQPELDPSYSYWKWGDPFPNGKRQPGTPMQATSTLVYSRKKDMARHPVRVYVVYVVPEI